TRQDIGRLIANENGRAEVEIQLCRRAQDHPRSRLAIDRLASVGAHALVGMKRAKVDLLDRDAVLSKDRAHPRCELREFLFRVIATADTRLIRDHGDLEAGPKRVPAQIEY